MFPKVFLTFLAIGALSVNALSPPVARGPAPEPDFQDVEARGMFEPQELQARWAEILDDLFSREPEDWVQESKREPLGTAAVASHKISESRTDTGDKPKKKHHHLFKREARNFFPNHHRHPHSKPAPGK